MRVLTPSRMLIVLLALAPPAAAQVTTCPATSSSIVINEIMYDPPGDPDVEYIELYNGGGTPVDLTSWFLLDDIDTHEKCFLAGTLNPGEYLVVAGFISLFSAKYPSVTNLNINEFDDAAVGQGFVLGDGGDAVRLFNAGGALMDCVVYNDTPPWPTEPDGDGPSLELYHPSLDNALATSWAASTNGPPEGTPGAQNSVFTTDQPPIVANHARDTPLPTSSDTVTVTATATDAIGLSMVELLVDTGAGYMPQLMFDDGMHGDNAAGDNLFGGEITPQPTGTLVRYYVRATDSSALSATLPPAAPGTYFAYTVDHTLPQLVINEILASNLNGIVDESMTPEDWLEIRNAGADPVSVKDMFLSNSLSQPQEWKLPDVTIPPGGYLLVWADDDDLEGPLHTNFKLSASGADVAIWESVDRGNVLIHGYKFGVQSTDVSYGYRPEATADAPEYLTTPTPGASNDTSALFSAVTINEFQTTSSGGGMNDDWVEFYNRGAAVVNMSGWFVTDEVDQPTKYTFPNGVFISPGAFVVLNETQLGFSFSSTGSEVVMLSDATGAGRDFFDYGPQQPDITQGRYPNGAPNWYFFSPPTMAASNNCNVVPPGDACDDGDACNGVETCSAGSCAAGTPVECNDTDACTDDTCVAGSCEYAPSGVCSIGGHVAYYRHNTGGGFEPSTKAVPGIDIDIDSDLVADATTNTGGDYSVAAGGAAQVAPLDEIVAIPHPIFNPAISSFDATFIAQRSVGLITLSANQRVAGDVSGNGAISAFDAALVAQFAVELIDRFPVAVSTGSDWAFFRCDNYVSASNQDCAAASYVHNPVTGSPADDFHAVLYGDVTGNWQAPFAKSADSTDVERQVAARDRETALRLRDASARGTALEPLVTASAPRQGVGEDPEPLPPARALPSGRERRTLMLEVDEGTGIRGLDIELVYDAGRVRIVDVRTGELSRGFNLVANDLPGSYRVALYGALPLKGSGSVLSITVETDGAEPGRPPLRVVAQADERHIPLTLTSGRPAPAAGDRGGGR